MFDNVASTYDQDFTHSNIGKALRNSVWEYVDKVLAKNSQLKVLELNCGTGEDAILFAQKGHQVFATDLSETMAKYAREKVVENKLQQRVDIFTCDVRAIDMCDFPSDFDLVFSNFGGLNCINAEELKKLSADLFQLLKPGGRFIAVVMPKFCAWESLYFLSKFEFGKMFRRNTSDSIAVSVGDDFVDTWYYSPAQFNHLFNNYFVKLAVKPVGMAIPPSYMESSIGSKEQVMEQLKQLEGFFGSISSLSNVSDHFLIDMIKKEKR